MELEAKEIEAQIYNHQEWVEEVVPDILKNKYEEKLKKAGFTIIKFDEYYFPEKGYTCFWLLAESHLAIHTFPEAQKSYIELSSCNEQKLKDFIKQ
ncbi:S-adenosylmethionine decarboxylase [Aquimarina rhabdastrellae]